MKILIPVDGTNASVPVVMQGGFVARAFGVRPTLLAVVPAEKHRQESQLILDQALKRLSDLGIEAETKTRFGHVSVELRAEIEEGGYDLLVLGRLRKLNWLERLFGNTATKVLTSMPTAILFAKGVSDDFDRLLLCESLGVEGTLIKDLKYRFPLFFKGGREITILHVMSQMGAQPGVKSWELRASAEELIDAGTLEGQLIQEELGALTEKSRAQVRPRVRHGPVVEEIMAEAEEGGYDLIVIGAHQASGWQGFLLENLAIRIVAASHKPVLILPRVRGPEKA
ncbi:MAG TPA: universal stress protein [Anaerolineales bacterium]|nr:universal stress protein [Anaerolineales bacterium]